MAARYGIVPERSQLWAEVNSSLHAIRMETDGFEGFMEVTFRVLDDKTIEIEGEKVIDMRSFGLEPSKLLVLKVHPEVKIRARVIAERER